MSTNDLAGWPLPTEGIEFDLQGPSADYLINTDHLYNQTVYQDIHALKEEWKVVTESNAEPYLPTRKDTINVSIGVEERKSIELSTFQSIKLDDYLIYKKGFVINTGGSIWGMDFVPKSTTCKDEHTQYLAMSGFRGSTEEDVAFEEITPIGVYKNAIQIWKMKLSVTQPAEEPSLDMCLLHDYGVVFDLKWCPFGTYEEEEEVSSNEGLSKLGILSFSCGDGTIRTIVVPHPDAVRKYWVHGKGKKKEQQDQTVYLHMKSSRCTFHLTVAYAIPIAWGGHKKLAAGYTKGIACIWDMEKALRDKEANNTSKSKRYLLQSIPVCDSTLRCITWESMSTPSKLFIGGSDGRYVLVDLNDPYIPLQISKNRALPFSCAWVSHSPFMLYIDGKGSTKSSTFDRNSILSSTKHGDSLGTCWTIAACEHHGQFVSGSSLGWLKSSNMYGLKVRAMLSNQTVIYKLDYNENNQTFIYIDGIGQLTADQDKEIPTFRVFGESKVSIQKAVWCPNKPSCAFLASGGAAGLCRIDFEGRGPKWS